MVLIIACNNYQVAIASYKPKNITKWREPKYSLNAHLLGAAYLMRPSVVFKMLATGTVLKLTKHDHLYIIAWVSVYIHYHYIVLPVF